MGFGSMCGSRQVHTLTPFAQVRDTTTTPSVEDFQRAQRRPRRTDFWPQQVNVRDDRRHVGPCRIGRLP